MTEDLSVEDMIRALESIPKRDIKLSDSQRKVINHEKGPLWIIAGPGSGKTETLVLRCLRLLLVDRVDPHSVMITTFTEKAGRNLQDRLILYKDHLAKEFPFVKDIDLTQLRVGTLHSLCNDILLEYRFPGYRNVRPMDDMEQLLFIYFHSGLARTTKDLTTKQEALFKHFQYMFDRHQQNVMKAGYMPNRWARATVAQSLFNRIIEDKLDAKSMTSEGEVWETLACEFQQYEQALNTNSRVDFAHMQSKLLEDPDC